MAGSIHQSVILAKIETTSGTDAAPTNLLNAMLIRVSGLSAKIEQKMASRDIVRSVFGAPDMLPYTRRGSIAFSVELASAGAAAVTAGTPPAWDALLQGCGFASASVATSGTTYTPTSASLKNLTLWAYINGKLEKFTYCAGSFKVSMKAGQLPTLDFSFTGLPVAAVTQVGAPAPTVTAWQRPLAMGANNTGKLFIGCAYAAFALSGGTGYNFSEINLDAANDVQDIELASAESVAIYGRNPSASLVADIGATDIATQYTNMNAGTLITVGLQHGVAAGSKVIVFAPAAAITGIDDQVNGSVMLNTMSLSLQPTAALNDDFRIVCA